MKLIFSDPEEPGKLIFGKDNVERRFIVFEANVVVRLVVSDEFGFGEESVKFGFGDEIAGVLSLGDQLLSTMEELLSPGVTLEPIF